MKCRTCRSRETTRHLLTLSNDDPDSNDEGLAVATVDRLYLCETCVERLADGLLDWRRLMMQPAEARV